MKYFIGISGYFHDSSVAILNEKGELVDFKKEEYFSRVKGDKSFPRMALEEIIKNFHLSEHNIINICFYEKPLKAWLSIIKYSIKNNSLKNELTKNYFKNIWKSSIIFPYDLSKYIKIKNKKIQYCDHHLSHTLSGAFYNSQLPVTSIVIDGFGDDSTSSIHYLKSLNEIRNIWSSPFPNSIGLFYSAITDFLGFSINEGEYKVMGLAAYGEPKFYDKLSETIFFKDNKLTLDDSYYDFVRSIKDSYSKKLKEIFNIEPRESNLNLDIDTPKFNHYADIAASAQKLTEDLLEKIFRFSYSKTGSKNFIFSGGVAMNSVAINKIAKLDFVEKIIIPPSPGDSGAAIGAAYYSFLKKNKNAKSNIIEKKDYHKLITPGKFNTNPDNEIFFLKDFEKITENNIEEIAADLISKNEIIATCYSNIETGPRALGHRSMICNAHSMEAVKHLNEKIKKRSKFRPVAPVVLEKNAKKYFSLLNNIYESYFYMGSVVDVINSKNIEAVVHKDNTARIQLCNEKHLLGKILLKLEEKNIDIIANTSFNISSDPMVYSLEDAYLAVKRMNIKYLMTENSIYKIKMNEQNI